MIERILNLFVVELIKAVRLRLTYLGPVLVLLTVVVAPLAYPIQRDQAGDYGFIAYAGTTEKATHSGNTIVDCQ